MAAPRLVVDLTIGKEDMMKLMAIARSRTGPASQVERARMLLAHRDEPSFTIPLLGMTPKCMPPPGTPSKCIPPPPMPPPPRNAIAGVAMVI
jgi:hypothetical protein